MSYILFLLLYFSFVLGLLPIVILQYAIVVVLYIVDG